MRRVQVWRKERLLPEIAYPAGELVAIVGAEKLSPGKIGDLLGAARVALARARIEECELLARETCRRCAAGEGVGRNGMGRWVHRHAGCAAERAWSRIREIEESMLP